MNSILEMMKKMTGKKILIKLQPNYITTPFYNTVSHKSYELSYFKFSEELQLMVKYWRFYSRTVIDDLSSVDNGALYRTGMWIKDGRNIVRLLSKASNSYRFILDESDKMGNIVTIKDLWLKSNVDKTNKISG